MDVNDYKNFHLIDYITYELHCLKNGNEHHVFIITHILSLKQTNRYLFENGMSSKNQNE